MKHFLLGYGSVGILFNGITFAVSNFHSKVSFILFVVSVLAGVISGNIPKRSNQ